MLNHSNPKDNINSENRISDQTLNFLSSTEIQNSLAQLNRGIEKEGLRTTTDGHLALTPHPSKLGAALTNSWVTTDFSESLLEFITPVHSNISSTLQFLNNTHTVAANTLDNEIIWASSMPCILPKDSDIPLAQYGTSNIALMKTAYRRGLGHRYGRAMQTVAGIHYNFSIPQSYWDQEAEQRSITLGKKVVANQDYISKRYLDLIRNFRRYYWLLIYLFGSTSVADPSFIKNRKHNLSTLSTGDLYLPHATSLRMGDLGYQSAAQKSLFICYNDLDNYVQTLRDAIHTPYSAYSEYGLLKSGTYQQLSTSLLQIENEFYSPIRPKRVTLSGEKPLDALNSRGIEYIEVRCLDINPFLPLGIDDKTIHFLDAFLMTCMNTESPQCDQEEFSLISKNQADVVNYGRKPSLKLFHKKREIGLTDYAKEILNRIEPIASILDKANNTKDYSASLATQVDKIENSSLTPSAQLLDILCSNEQSFVNYTLDKSREFMTLHRTQKIDVTQNEKLLSLAHDSLLAQAQIEQDDKLSFDQFLNNYFSS